MEKNTKILLGIGAAILTYILLRPKNVLTQSNLDVKNSNDLPESYKIGLTYQNTANQGDVILFKTDDGVFRQGIAAGIQSTHDFNNADDWVTRNHYSGFDIIGVYSIDSPTAAAQLAVLSKWNPPTGLEIPTEKMIYS